MVSPGPSQEHALVVYPDGPSFAGHRPSSPWYEEPRFPESGVLASAYAPGVGVINASGETADLETWIPQLLHEIGDTVGFPTDPLLAAMQPVTAAVAAGLRSVESVEFVLSEIDANPKLWSHKSSSHDVKPDFSIECLLEFPRSGNSPDADQERIVKSSVQLSARNRSTRSQPVPTGTARRRSSAAPSDRNADRPKPGPSKTKLDLSTTRHVRFDQATLEKWLSGYLRVSLLRDGISAATGALALRTVILANDPHTAASLRLLDCAGIAGTVVELAKQSASVTGDQVLATLHLEITMTSSQDAATRRAEMSFARAQSAALLKGRPPQPPTTLPPRAPQADGYHLRLVLDRLEVAKGSSASSIEALHEPIQLQHQTGAHGYVTLNEATRSVEYPGSTVRRPFIMEAYDAHGSLIGLAKLPESFKLPFSDWVSVRDPFTGKDRLFAHIRLEEMAVANATDAPRVIAAAKSFRALSALTTITTPRDTTTPSFAHSSTRVAIINANGTISILETRKTHAAATATRLASVKTINTSGAFLGAKADINVIARLDASEVVCTQRIGFCSFEPAFNEEVSIEFALDKEVLDALGRAEAVIRVWHQEPNAAMAKGQTVLLGSARVSLRDLLLSQSGARGDFALTSPVDANIDDKTRAHPPLGHVRAAIFFEHHRELAQYFPPDDLATPFSSAAHYIATDATSVDDDDDDDDDDDAFGEGGEHVDFEDDYKDSILPPESAATDEHLVVQDNLGVSLPLLTGEAEEGSDDDERIVLQAPLSTPLNDRGDAALSPTQDRFESENDSMMQPLSASRGGGMLCVSVEEAMHLPMVLVRDSLQPPLPYVSFVLHGPRFSDARHTQPNPDGSSCNPRWFEDLRLPIENLGQLRDGILRFHVWHRASWQRDSVEDHGSVVSEGGARHPPPGLDFDPYSNGLALQHRTIAETSAVFGDNDIYLGTAVVDLSTLDVGIDRVHGWYHVIDAEQRRVGQVKVKVSIVRASSGVKDNDFAATSAEETVSSNTFASRDVSGKEDAKHDQDSEAALSPAALADAMQSLDLVSERLRMRMLRLENSSPAPQDNAGASVDRQVADEKEDQQENDGGITMCSQSGSNIDVEIPPSGASGDLESLDLNDGVAPVEPPRPQDTETLHSTEIMHTLEDADNLSPHPFDGAAAVESIHTTSEAKGGIGESDLVENTKTGEENYEVVKDCEETSSIEHGSALAADDDAINAALDQVETAIEGNTTDGIFDGDAEEDIEKRQESADVLTPADAGSGMVLEESASELHETIYGTQEAVSNDLDASKAHQVGETTSLARGQEEEDEEEEEEGTFDFENEEVEKCVFGPQDVIAENDEERISESRKGDIRLKRSAFSPVNWNEEHQQVEEEEDSFAEQPTKGTLANPDKDSVSSDAEAHDGSRDSTLSPGKYGQSVSTVEGVGGFQEHDIDQVQYVVDLHANEEDQEETTFAKSSNADLDELEFHGKRASQDPKAHESDSESSLSSEGAKSVLSSFAVDPMKMPDLPSTHYNQLAQVGPELPQAHICSGQEARVRRLSVSPIQVNETMEVGTPSLFASEEKRRMAKKNTWMDPETARIARILRGDSSKASN
ncbi:Hypothetical Protein FCC1311_049642 [Hondaea fermentalgiana]|uniref:C2 domain-containing protein n=1 Tax=Hondaea fermentalgiana TaxID=2315210 RepID=A0A2R5GJA6_9STRA|nr:Hypothetical Protein FCC1311_049642 [Hondaea fermentalgiana]|eukprot:GBG28743.1 Hypothetical Protein FCC1311_049642 [Hondaea fermentalgiana]